MSGDLMHTPTPVTKIRTGDIVIGEQGVMYLVESRRGTTITYDGGIVIEYPDDTELTVLTPVA